MKKIYFRGTGYLMHGCFFITLYFQLQFLKSRRKHGNNLNHDYMIKRLKGTDFSLPNP